MSLDYICLPLSRCVAVALADQSVEQCLYSSYPILLCFFFIKVSEKWKMQVLMPVIGSVS